MVRKYSRLEDLAIIGGKPSFKTPLHVNRPSARNLDKFHSRVAGMMSSRWFTNNGPFVSELEEQLADFLGVKHCISTCNGTSALQLAGKALGFAGEVIVPSFTFIGTAHAFYWQGIKPVFCDIDPLSHNLDPAACEKLIGPRTTGIVGVHLWGRPCDISQLQSIASRHGLPLVFDAAHAFACSSGGKMLGGFGNAEIFSFHATKTFHTFEGGAIATNDDQLANQVRLMRNFGFSDFDTVSSIGTNAKMPEICAAIGLSNLESINQTIDENRETYQEYKRLLTEMPGLSMLPYDAGESHNYHYVVLEVDPKQCHLNRDHLSHVLHAEGAISRRYFHPGCHLSKPYVDLYSHERGRLIHTEQVASRTLVLPAGNGVTLDEIGRICEIIRLCVNNADQVRSKLEKSGIAHTQQNSTVSE